MKTIHRPTTLLCFNPFVMASTFAVEAALAVYVLVRYKLDKRGYLAVAILGFLASFQFIEYVACTIGPNPPLELSRLGYVAITMLPPLGVHLVTLLRREKPAHLVWGGYALAAVFSGFFLLSPTGVERAVCTGNYVILLLSQPASFLYGVYYFGLELLGLWLAFSAAPKAKAAEKRALHWMGAGYLAIILPTLLLRVVAPQTGTGVPSIMCGFALVFALIIGLRVIPLVQPLALSQRRGKRAGIRGFVKGA